MGSPVLFCKLILQLVIKVKIWTTDFWETTWGTTHLHLMSRLRMSGGIPPLPHMP